MKKIKDNIYNNIIKNLNLNDNYMEIENSFDYYLNLNAEEDYQELDMIID